MSGGVVHATARGGAQSVGTPLRWSAGSEVSGGARARATALAAREAKSLSVTANGQLALPGAVKRSGAGGLQSDARGGA